MNPMTESKQRNPVQVGAKRWTQLALQRGTVLSSHGKWNSDKERPFPGVEFYFLEESTHLGPEDGGSLFRRNVRFWPQYYYCHNRQDHSLNNHRAVNLT
jgi:hypothetical protein